MSRDPGEILPTDSREKFEAAVHRAVARLRSGEIVALPTETVYGLAANAFGGRAARLTRTHGDFHPFNIVFSPPGADPGAVRFTLLDASRGGQGDPADDLVALSVNYVFFALEHAGAWRRGLGGLWRRFWEISLDGRRDPGVLESAPPYLAWRALVLSCPRFYPGLGAAAREKLEQAMQDGAVVQDTAAGDPALRLVDAVLGVSTCHDTASP